MSIRPLFTESTVVLFSDELFCIRVHQKPGPALCRHHPTPSGPSTHPLHHPFALKPLSMPRWPRRSACWAATGNDRWLVAANAAVQSWPCSGAVCPAGARPSQWPAFHPRPKHPPGAWPLRDRYPWRSQPTPHKATRKPPNRQTGKYLPFFTKKRSSPGRCCRIMITMPPYWPPQMVAMCQFCQRGCLDPRTRP